MRRREFLTLLGSVPAWPLAARAQQSDARRVAFMRFAAATDPEGTRRSMAFERGLESLGWMIGRNLLIDYHWGIDSAARASTAMVELMKLSPDVILAGEGSALAAAQQATCTVPIVFTGISEPVARGVYPEPRASRRQYHGVFEFGAHLRRQVAGTAQGACSQGHASGDRFNPSSSGAKLFFNSIEGAAKQFSVEANAVQVRSAADIEREIAAFARLPNGGVISVPDGFSEPHLFVGLAARYMLPAIYPFRSFAYAGGLASYGNDVGSGFGQAATYVDRILRGAKPADLPVVQPTQFELFINLKTAKALGLTVPSSLLARADEVIE